MKIHKQYISEWKSVSDDVKTLADTIVKIMWYKSENDSPQYDDIIHLVFIEGEFPLHMSTIFNDGEKHFNIDKLNVSYKIYFVDDENEYNENLRYFKTSEYNDEEQTIYVRGALIRGEYNKTIIEDVYHELTHAFEYGMGMEKRKELYDIVSQVIGNEESSELDTVMCKMVYYTFPHEQDAFAHQFYGNLNANEIGVSFTDALYSFGNYLDFHQCIMKYTRACSNDKENVKRILNYLGMTKEQFDKRFKFGRKRFENKLRRVYDRHMYELEMKNNTVKGTIECELVSKGILNEFNKRYNNIPYKRNNHEW